VDNPEAYESFSAAVIAQLNAEIAGAGLKRAELARKLGMDYVTLGRYLKGEREIPVIVLYAIIDQLPIDEAGLFKLARERYDRR
jgi:transcriptional regulator with XRE-family HTH domain